MAVELLGAAQGDEVSFAPVLVVDGDSVYARPAELAGAKVSAALSVSKKGRRSMVLSIKTRPEGAGPGATASATPPLR